MDKQADKTVSSDSIFYPGPSGSPERESGNYQKYTSRNPLMRRATGDFLDCIAALARSSGASTILDAGCGEAFLAGRIRPGYLVGLDISSGSLTVARHMNPDMPLVCGDVCRMPFPDESFELVMLCEVLEHLREPEIALAEAARITGRFCIFSAPREPYFMLANLLRGKNISRLGNDREHVGHWTSGGFAGLVSRHFAIREIRSPFPWTVILCEKKQNLQKNQNVGSS